MPVLVKVVEGQPEITYEASMATTTHSIAYGTSKNGMIEFPFMASRR